MKYITLLAVFALSCASLWAQSDKLDKSKEELLNGKTHKYEIRYASLTSTAKKSGYTIPYPRSWRPMIDRPSSPYGNEEASMFTIYTAADSKPSLEDLDTEQKCRQWVEDSYGDDAMYLVSEEFNLHSGEKAVLIVMFRISAGVFYTMIITRIGDDMISSSFVVKPPSKGELDEILNFVGDYNEVARSAFEKIEKKKNKNK